MHALPVVLVAALVFLIGIAMVVGATGSLNMAEIAARASDLEGFAQPALGRVLSIRKLDDYWVVVGSARSLAQAPTRLDDDEASRP